MEETSTARKSQDPSPSRHWEPAASPPHAPLVHGHPGLEGWVEGQQRAQQCRVWYGGRNRPNYSSSPGSNTFSKGLQRHCL